MANAKVVAKKCEECAGTGILRATLVKNDQDENEAILVKLCTHFDPAGEESLEALTNTGLEIRYQTDTSTDHASLKD